MNRLKVSESPFHKIRRIQLLILLLVFVFSNLSCHLRKVKNYNVVLIVIDTLRSDHLPFYGYKKNTAPFMSDLARQSVVFKNAFSASSWTSPATASIFTSLYPFQHGVLLGLMAILKANAEDPSIRVNRIPEEIETLPEVMKKNGFRTYGVSDNLNIGIKQGFTQGFDRFETFNYNGAPRVNDVLKKWKPEMDRKGKYFLYLHYMDPHAPYHHRKPLFEPNPDKKKMSISAYDSEIHYVDSHLREIFDLFGWKKNTLIIITADHGEGLWDHGTMGHGFTLYREEFQVPLVIFLAEKRTGKVVPANVSTMDILPTIRELTGLAAAKKDQGVSLVPLIRKPENKVEQRFIFSYLWKLGEEKGSDIEFRSVVYKRLHLMMRFPDKRELYDLLRDSGEKNDRFITNQKSARYLELKFSRFYKKCKKFNPESIYYQLNKEKVDKLKTLGYVR
jgi:choline-sulfatase